MLTDEEVSFAICAMDEADPTVATDVMAKPTRDIAVDSACLL